MRKKILTNMKRAIYDFNLIEEGDKVCVGISGGKDSMALIHALNTYKRYAPFKFDIVAINLIMGFPNMDFTIVKKYFENNKIEFIQYPTQIYEILKLNLNKDGSLKCSLCSKFKKALIITAAKEHNCTKVAFGHHADDAIETLFLNAIHGGKIATFKPRMYMDRTDTVFIRPFVYAREQEISSYIETEKIPLVKSTCPNDGFTQRTSAKSLLNNIYKEYPSAYDNFLLMLSNIDKIDLWEKESIGN